MAKDYPWGNGTITTIDVESVIGAGGVERLVPAGKVWYLISLICDVTCTATVGNRAFGVKLSDGVRNIAHGPTSAVATASQIVGYDVTFKAAGATSTTVRRNLADDANTNVQISASVPMCLMKAGYSINFHADTSADVNDVVSFRLQYVEYDA